MNPGGETLIGAGGNNPVVARIVYGHRSLDLTTEDYADLICALGLAISEGADGGLYGTGPMAVLMAKLAKLAVCLEEKTPNERKYEPMKPTIEIQIEPAPSSPLNLKFGVIYAPRAPSELFTGFAAWEVSADVFDVIAYDGAGGTHTLFRGNVGPAWQTLAISLGMGR